MVYVALRYYAAFMLLSYGFAKIMGAQFTVLDSQLDEPLKHVSGFWLTWYYFGLSPVYSTIIAVVQIGGAALLCFRRTAFAGALILLPVMANIVLIDAYVIQWRLSSGAFRNAVYVLAALLAVLGFHHDELSEIFWRRQKKVSASWGSAKWVPVARILLVLAMFAYTAHEAYWVANVNNRSPTPLDGAWQVAETIPANASLPRTIYFEYNRAYMCVFRMPDGRLETHDFRADTASHTLSINQQWLERGPSIFQGNWKRDGNALTLTGEWQGSSANPVTVRMTRENMPVKDHE